MIDLLAAGRLFDGCSSKMMSDRSGTNAFNYVSQTNNPCNENVEIAIEEKCVDIRGKSSASSRKNWRNLSTG